MYKKVNQLECMADLCVHQGMKQPEFIAEAHVSESEPARVHGRLTCMSMLPWTRKAPPADLQAWRVGGTWLGLPLCCQSTATRKLFVLGLVGVVMKLTLAKQSIVV